MHWSIFAPSLPFFNSGSFAYVVCRSVRHALLLYVCSVLRDVWWRSLWSFMAKSENNYVRAECSKPQNFFFFANYVWPIVVFPRKICSRCLCMWRLHVRELMCLALWKNPANRSLNTTAGVKYSFEEVPFEPSAWFEIRRQNCQPVEVTITYLWDIHKSIALPPINERVNKFFASGTNTSLLFVVVFVYRANIWVACTSLSSTKVSWLREVALSRDKTTQQYCIIYS